MNRRLLGLALLAPLALAPAAQAALPSGNIVNNGDAEDGPGATNQTDSFPPPSWEDVTFTAVQYGSGGFPSMSDSAAIGGDLNFFAGGPPNEIGFAGANQRIDLSAAAAEIDSAGVNATLSADLGGLGAREDRALVAATFEPSNPDNPGLVLQPVTAAERGNATRFVRRTHCRQLEPGTRRITVTILAQGTGGQYNHGYADNVSLTLSTEPCEAPPPPLPPPAPPQAKVTANAEPVRGRILVKQPGSNTFQELRDARSIPVGSEVNAEKGEVEMQTAANTTGATQVGKFRDGTFVMTQSGSGRRLMTDVTLAGTRLDKCPRRGTQTSAAARRRSRTRRLWGNARGRFRTRGRYASATIRGTRWMVRDTCTSTTVQARTGVVIARDLVKRRNVRLKAPKRYTARARR